jgi:hypothetical protein
MARRNPQPDRLDGISVYWAQEGDKNLAQEWPAWVEHGEMDHVRHAARPNTNQSRSSWQELSKKLHGERPQVEPATYQVQPQGTPRVRVDDSAYPLPKKAETEPAATTKEREPMWKRLWPFNRQGAQEGIRPPRA